MVGTPFKGVSTALKRYDETQSNANRKRCGGPRKTTIQHDRHIQLISTRDPFKTVPDIRAEVNQNHSQPIAITTVRRRLKAKNLKGRVALPKTAPMRH